MADEGERAMKMTDVISATAIFSVSFMSFMNEVTGANCHTTIVPSTRNDSV
jgi:hypothetical protein